MPAGPGHLAGAGCRPVTPVSCEFGLKWEEGSRRGDRGVQQAVWVAGSSPGDVPGLPMCCSFWRVGYLLGRRQGRASISHPHPASVPPHLSCLGTSHLTPAPNTGDEPACLLLPCICPGPPPPGSLPSLSCHRLLLRVLCEPWGCPWAPSVVAAAWQLAVPCGSQVSAAVSVARAVSLAGVVPAFQGSGASGRMDLASAPRSLGYRGRRPGAREPARGRRHAHTRVHTCAGCLRRGPGFVARGCGPGACKPLPSPGDSARQGGCCVSVPGARQGRPWAGMAAGRSDTTAVVLIFFPLAGRGAGTCNGFTTSRAEPLGARAGLALSAPEINAKAAAPEGRGASWRLDNSLSVGTEWGVCDPRPQTPPALGGSLGVKRGNSQAGRLPPGGWRGAGGAFGGEALGPPHPRLIEEEPSSTFLAPLLAVGRSVEGCLVTGLSCVQPLVPEAPRWHSRCFLSLQGC